MPQIKRAVVLEVDFGFDTIQGLMLPDGTYAIAVSQIASQFSVSPTNATKTVKALLDKDSGLFYKVASELNNRPVNTVSIRDFKTFVVRLSQKGDPVAAAFVEAMVHEGIERRFDTAAGKKVEESEYNKRLAQRMERVTARFEWTDAVMSRGLEKTGHKPGRGTYRDLTVKVNRVLFNRDHFYCDRDNMTPNQQRTITAFETMVANFANLFPDDSPDQLIERALVAWNGGQPVKSLK